MGTEFTSSGNPARSIELLWGLRERARRGPKPRFSLEQIVDTATGIADRDGLGALSMRRVAEELGTTAMSLYTYVPGKAELLDLMVDRVSGERILRLDPGDGWRSQLVQLARAEWEGYQQHPWLLQTSITSRPVLGPNVIASYERALEAVEGLGLTDIEMDSVVELLSGYVREAARGAIEASIAPRVTGMTDEQWWQAHEPFLEHAIEADQFPLASRVGTAVGGYHPAQIFEFGLERVLDGIAVLVERRGGPLKRGATVPLP